MSISALLRWVPGWVRVEAEGGYPARLLNTVTAEGITLWGVHQRGERLRFCCFARDYRYLRSPARRACMRMRLGRKSGLPFWVHRYRHRRGLAVGLAVYALVLALLSPRIWVVEVVGATDTPREDILAVATQMGVTVGAKTGNMNIKGLEIDGLRQLPTLAFVTVNPSGSVARIEVKERAPTPQVLDLSEPSDIVALRDGQIISMDITGGYRVAKDGEAVTAGSLLITGRKQTEQGERLYRSYGHVWALTRRQITVTVPLEYTVQRPDGFVAVRPTLTFLAWRIPLYGGDTPGEGYRHTQIDHFLQSRGMTLPLGVTTDYYIRTYPEKLARTAVQAAKVAEGQLTAQEQALFAPDSYHELSRKAGVEGANYVLRVTYQCKEDIALEVPIK